MRLLIVVLSLSITLLSYGQGKIDVLHYRYEILLDDLSDSIKCKATIRVLFLKQGNELILDLSSVAQGKGMTVFSIVDSIDENKLLASTHFADKLKITFPEKINSTEVKTIIIRYKGIPADGLIISKNKFGNRTFFSDNWPNRAHHWMPCVDDPSDKASVEFIVTVPSHYQVISNGIQIEETNLPNNKKLTHYKEDVPLPTKVMVIGVADFAVSRAGEVDCVPVYSWVFPENKKEGFYDYAEAKEILDFFIKYIGPYPYKKLANVQSKTMFGGMENAGAIFYFENSVTGNKEHETLIAHEIVHQWFGNMATEKSFAHIWLSEGFATYLTHLYVEAKYGTDSLDKRMQSERQEIIAFTKTSHNPVVDSVSSYMQLLNTNSYQKGGWVLHMLRRQLGDSVFKKGIRTYYEKYAGKNADTRDLQMVFETVSGKNLEQFFTQWLYTPANPKLDITWKYNKSENKIAITVKQLQQTGNFEFPLEILIQESRSSMPKRTLKTISKNSETFFFPVKSKPFRVEIDPMVSLLYEGTVTESK